VKREIPSIRSQEKTPEESDGFSTPLFYRLILTFGTGIITSFSPDSHLETLFGTVTHGQLPLV